MYLYGAGGQAKVVLDILEDNGISVDGIFDDNSAIKELHGIKVSKVADAALNKPVIISIGNNKQRERIAQTLQSSEFGKAIHSSAIVSKTALVGDGSIITQGCVIQAEAEIGRHVIINTGASVGHECRISDFVHLHPHATLCGNVKVGVGTQIGASTVIIPNLTIGKWCVIEPGTIIVKDIPDYARVSGNPARMVEGKV